MTSPNNLLAGEAMTESLLREIAAIKRHDPNAIRGFKKSTLTLNVPHELLDRIDELLSASKPAATEEQEATEGYAFRSDGKLWVVTDAVVAMKWQEQGFQVTPVQAAPAQSAHPDDLAVDQFAAAMKEKLAQARAKGRSGWQQCDPALLSSMLREHVEKGDPRDVANFCMMLWHLEKPIAAQPTKYPKVAGLTEREQFIRNQGYAEGIEASAEKVATQSVDFIFPPMPNAVVVHDKVGPLFDRLSMQFYASKCMSLATPQSSQPVEAGEPTGDIK